MVRCRGTCVLLSSLAGRRSVGCAFPITAAAARDGKKAVYGSPVGKTLLFAGLPRVARWSCPSGGLLAGDAVLIAPTSGQIPWYQGILQGIFRFWGLGTRFISKKPLRCSHFSSNFLSKLTGKTFWGTRNLFHVSRNLIGKPCHSRAALPLEMSKREVFSHFAHTRPIDSDSGFTNGSLKQNVALLLRFSAQIVPP